MPLADDLPAHLLSVLGDRGSAADIQYFCGSGRLDAGTILHDTRPKIFGSFPGPPLNQMYFALNID